MFSWNFERRKGEWGSVMSKKGVEEAWYGVAVDGILLKRGCRRAFILSLFIAMI
jgi:hypothetical protein